MQEAEPTAAWQYRLKVGEALAQSLQRCGEATPVYAPRVLPAFIRGAQPGPGFWRRVGHDGGGMGAVEAVEEEAHFRASCLSALGDVCEALGWSLQRRAHDIVELATGVLALEQGRRGAGAASSSGAGAGDDEAAAAGRARALAVVRRGAAFLLERVALGLGPSRVVPVLGLEGLQAATEAARRASERDRDEVVRVHARRALGAFEAALLEQVYERMDPSRTVTALQEVALGGRGGSAGDGIRLPGVGGLLLRERRGRGGGNGGGL